MPKRGENIHKRKDGRWEGRIKVGRKENGASKYTSVYGKTYREAKEKQKELIRLENIKPKIQSGKTFSEILQLWMRNNSLRQKESTKLKYQFIIEHHINPELGMVLISEVNGTLINNFLNKKQKEGRLDDKGGLGPAYIKTIACIINSALQFAVDQNYCMPVRLNIAKPMVPKKELSILNKNLQIKLENYLTNNCSLTGLGILITLNTGLRIGEICALKWEDINLQDELITVHHTVSRISNTNPELHSETYLIIDEPKTQSSMRNIPISSKLLPLLQQMKQNAVSEFVISDKETFVSPRTYEYRFHRQLELCGIPQINYHALRHTFATRCIEVGVDVKTLSEFMGHANTGITLNTYVHPSMELKRKQIEKLSTISETDL